MESADQSNPCAICLGSMDARAGQAMFTAECSHTFHFHCIAASVAHGHRVCPLCNARWRELPFAAPAQPPPPPPPAEQRFYQAMEPRVFADDEPVEPTPYLVGAQHQAVSNGAALLKTHTEYSDLTRDASHDSFAVLVHLKAPAMAAAAAWAARAPLDLVTVLDVSGSMEGSKLALLKQAIGFVIDNLGPADRLCIVAFSTAAHRLIRLTRMSEHGKGLAMQAVESLYATGCTNIAQGLQMAANVLNERRHRNAVTSVILLSDGQDTYTVPGFRGYGGATNYEGLVPPFFLRPDAGNRSPPIHAFGFGIDHDAAAMHSIAETTRGTFSFIEYEAVIQDAFAQCIGGLLSVVMQEALIAITCLHHGVRVTAVKSGRYESSIDAHGRTSAIDIGELYADEERRFLVFLHVPPAGETEEETHLIKVTCSYRDTAAGAVVQVAGEDAVVKRPVQVVDAERSVEVHRERVRLQATDDIAAARAAAERGSHTQAVAILDNRRRAVAQSAVVLPGDAMWTSLESELEDMSEHVSSQPHYERSGRAYMLARLSSHSQQRATLLQTSSELDPVIGTGMPPFRGASAAAATSTTSTFGSASGSGAYLTPSMQIMVERSRKSRAAQQQPQPQPPQKPPSEQNGNL